MHPRILNWNITIVAVLTDFTNTAVMLSDLLRNLTFNRSAHCTQVSDQCPLGLLLYNFKSTYLNAIFINNRTQQQHWMKSKSVDASVQYIRCCCLEAQWRRYIHLTYSRNDTKIDRKLALTQGSGSKVYPRIAEATALNTHPHWRI